MSPITPGPRYRERGSTTRDSEIRRRAVQCDGTVQPTDYLLSHRYGVVEGMHDVVTPKALSLIQKGQIVNNPMSSVKQTFYGGGVWGVNSYSGCTAGTPSAVKEVRIDVYFREQDNYLYNEVRDLEGKLTLKPFIVDVGSVQRHCHTAALSGVDDSTMQGLVTMGELGKTLALLRNPIKAVSMFTEKWAKSRTMQKAIRGGPTAVADQYLTYYYGIKPTIRDVENAISAYVNSEVNPERMTSRKTASDQKVQTLQTGGNPGTGGTWNLFESTTSEEIHVRAGILYSIDRLASIRSKYGLRLSDVPYAVLELTPWSFFANYFANIYEIVGALSPRIGVTYLAAWDVIKFKQTDHWQIIASGTNEPNFSRTAGTEYAGRILEGTLRVPTSPYSNIGLSLLKASKIANWSTQKDLAVVALLFKQISGHHRHVATALNT